MNQDNVKFSERNKQRGNPYLLIGVAILLCMSMVMSIFTPMPLALVQILYGKIKGVVLGLLGAVIIYFLSENFKMSYGSVALFIYMLSFAVSFMLATMVEKKLNPLKSFFQFGWILTLLLGLIFSGGLYVSNVNLNQYMANNVKTLSEEIQKDKSKFVEMKGEDTQEFLDLISQPEKAAKEIVQLIPRSLFIGIFFFIWLNTYLLLRSKHLYLLKVYYPYTVRDFLRLKLPEYFIWPVIACLLVLVLGEEYFAPYVLLISENILYGFGLFYFFQGFGIYYEFLNFLNIQGFFRSLLLVFTIMSGYWVLVFMGLFDMWVDFRRFFKRKQGPQA